jgi:hypothetical protein
VVHGNSWVRWFWFDLLRHAAVKVPQQSDHGGLPASGIERLLVQLHHSPWYWLIKVVSACLNHKYVCVVHGTCRYAFNIIFNILNKSSLNAFPCPWFISAMQLSKCALELAATVLQLNSSQHAVSAQRSTAASYLLHCCIQS